MRKPAQLMLKIIKSAHTAFVHQNLEQVMIQLAIHFTWQLIYAGGHGGMLFQGTPLQRSFPTFPYALKIQTDRACIYPRDPNKGYWKPNNQQRLNILFNKV